MKLLLFLLLVTSALHSAPAYSGKHPFKQPDGTMLTVHTQGDEYLHWIETDAGEIALLNKQKQQLEYAIIRDKKLVPSGESITPSAMLSPASKHPARITKKELHRLWVEKRKEEMRRRHEGR